MPRVTLELTAGTRRFRITRSPEFLRPKKRGTGVVSVQAAVTLEERRGGRWVALSTRHDEVADVVKDALGMGMAQFAKVVLLPQGDFAAFLRATPEDRREVLERLFDISAFSDVEAWLADARRAAGADLAAARSALESLLVRVEDVLADAHDAAGGPVTSPSEVPPESVGTHLRAVADLLDSRVSTTMAAFDTASGAERAAAEALAAARAIDDLRSRGQRAVARLAGLEAARPSHVERGGGLAAAGAGLRPGRTPHRPRQGDRRRRHPVVVRSGVPATRSPSGPLAALPDGDCDRGARPAAALDGTAAALGREADDEARALASTPRRSTTVPPSPPRPGRASRGRARPESEVERELLDRPGRRRRLPALLGCPLQPWCRRGPRQGDGADMAEHDLARAERLVRRTMATCAPPPSTVAATCSTCGSAGSTAWQPSSARALTDGDPCAVCGALERPSRNRGRPGAPYDIARAERRLEAAAGRARSVEAQIDSLRTLRRHPGREPRRHRPRDPRPRGGRGPGRALPVPAPRRCPRAASRGPAAGSVVTAVEVHRRSVAGTLARLEGVATP